MIFYYVNKTRNFFFSILSNEIAQSAIQQNPVLYLRIPMQAKIKLGKITSRLN